MTALNIPEVGEVGVFRTWSGAFIYGIMISGFISCMRSLFCTKSFIERSLHKALVLVSIWMTVLATVDQILRLVVVAEAISLNADDSNVLLEWVRKYLRLQTALSSIYVAQTLLADGVLTYRCWALFERRWYALVLPGTAFACNIALGIVFTTHMSKQPINQGGGSPKDLVKLGLSFLCLTLALNVLVTIAIVWRLAVLQTLSQQTEATSDTVQARTQWAISLIVESGSIYCIGLIGLIITTVVKNSERANIVFSSFMVSVIPLAFNLLTIRIHRGRTTERLRSPCRAHLLEKNSPTESESPQGGHQCDSPRLKI